MNENEILFKIFDNNLETGLRGMPVGYCTTSFVDPIKGLFYKGKAIKELAHKDPEEVMYLLLNGSLPNEAEYADFAKTLKKRRGLNPKILELLKKLPSNKDPMKMFIIGICLMGLVDGKNDYREDAFNIFANLPELVAAIFRISMNWGDLIPPDENLGLIENFVHMLSPPGADKELLAKVLRIFEILHYDHGGGNASAFTGKVASSTHSDLYESLTAAMAALAGPLHGKANQESLLFLKDISKNMSDPSDAAEVKKYIENLLDSGKKVFGFGHAVLRAEDQRASIQYDFGETVEAIKNDQYFVLAKVLRNVVPKILATHKKISSPYPNVDQISGVLLHASGLKNETFYTVLFGMSRCVGITAQLFYERLQARDGKGTPIIRPKYLYKSI